MSAWLIRALLLMTSVLAGCRPPAVRQLKRDGNQVARAASRGDGSKLQAYRLVSDPALIADEEIGKVTTTALRAFVLLAPGFPVEVVYEGRGWRFAEDPTLVYARDTPRNALRALVYAWEHEDFEVLVTLAPERFRTGLQAKKLAAYWQSETQYASIDQLISAVSDHILEPIAVHGTDARFDLGISGTVFLEKEAGQWVIESIQ